MLDAPMQIRQAKKEDLEACLSADRSYVTDRVWQLVEQARGDETILTFRPGRLPRPLRVEYPRPIEDLATSLENDDCFLVAEQAGQFRGFVNLTIADWHRTGWLKHLVVVEPFRRRGTGTQLLRAAISWGELHGLHTIMAECQTKNHPAILLYQKNGFVFCGYNDRYYVNQDIALFFAYVLRARPFR